MKRILATLLTLALLISCCSALADYDTHISFTMNGTHTNSNMDYNHDEMYDYIAGMFNFDYEVWPVSKDAQLEKIRNWVATGTMPDTVTQRDFKYQEYVENAEQGLLAPLPEGWETKYPDLYDMMKSSMSADALEKFYIDGACYGIAHARNYRYVDFDVLVDHLSVYYRKDWAKELGFEFGDVITLSELKAYLKACIDNDMAKNGNTMGLTDEPGYLARFWMLFADVPYDKFHKTDDGYAWGFTDPTVVEALKIANEWYAEGLIDHDFYLNKSENSISNFTSGIAAAFYHNCAVSSYLGYATTFEQSTGLKCDDCIAIATIATDDGVTRAEETDNWWSVTMFNPDIDAEKLDRLLSMMNWACTEEGEITIMLGLRGKIWDFDENHEVKMLIEPDENGNYPNTQDLYPSYSVFRTQGINADDFAFINPSNDRKFVDPIIRAYAVRNKGHINMMDANYTFFSSESKANFSLDLSDEIGKLIMGKADEVESGWKAYIEENKSLWQPVVDDLNAAFCK